MQRSIISTNTRNLPARAAGVARRRLACVCASLLAATALSAAAAPAASAADTYCPSGYTCVWSAYDFDGTKQLSGAGDEGRWTWFNAPKLSMKNHFTNRAVWWYDGFSYPCLNPGLNLPYVYAYGLYVGATGSRC